MESSGLQDLLNTRTNNLYVEGFDDFVIIEITTPYTYVFISLCVNLHNNNNFIFRYLGNKKFLHGDTPTTIDCVIFGHLAQFLYIPMEFPQVSFYTLLA